MCTLHNMCIILIDKSSCNFLSVSILISSILYRSVRKSKNMPHFATHGTEQMKSEWTLIRNGLLSQSIVLWRINGLDEWFISSNSRYRFNYILRDTWPEVSDCKNLTIAAHWLTPYPLRSKPIENLSMMIG